MLTLEEFKSRMERGSRVHCHNDEERNQVIEFLLNVGYVHGGSGASSECLLGSHKDYWMYPYLHRGEEIEFYGGSSETQIELHEIIHLMEPVPATPVDDLL